MIKFNTISNNVTWKRYLKNPNKFIQNKIHKLNKKFKKYEKKIIYCTLVLTGSNEIKKLNKKFRKKNKPTDVLSFPFLSKQDLKLKKEKNIYIGDIAVCYEIIKKRSKKTDFFLEFNKVWVHGLLHLIGYNHIKNKDYIKMAKIEEKIISLL